MMQTQQLVCRLTRHAIALCSIIPHVEQRGVPWNSPLVAWEGKGRMLNASLLSVKQHSSGAKSIQEGEVTKLCL